MEKKLKKFKVSFDVLPLQKKDKRSDLGKPEKRTSPRLLVELETIQHCTNW